MADTREVFLPNLLHWNGRRSVTLTFQDIIETQLESFDRFITNEIKKDEIDEATLFIHYENELKTKTPVFYLQFEDIYINETGYIAQIFFVVHEYDMFRNFFDVVDEIKKSIYEVISIIKTNDLADNQLKAYIKSHNETLSLSEIRKIICF